MAGTAKFRIHIEAVMLSTMMSSTPNKRNKVTATEPFTSQSKITKPGITEEIKYMLEMIGIAIL